MRTPRLFAPSMMLVLSWCPLALVACDGTPAPGTSTSASATPVGAASQSGSPGAQPAALVARDAGVDDAGDGGDAATKRPPLPRVRALEVPEEAKSPLPKPDEWRDVVRRDVLQHPEYSCNLQRLREWHRITCDCSNATVALVTGTRDGVSVWSTPDSAQLLFPVRRGDRRVFEVRPNDKVVGFGGPYGGPGMQPGGPPVVFSETWLEGEDAPTFVIQ